MLRGFSNGGRAGPVLLLLAVLLWVGAGCSTYRTTVRNPGAENRTLNEELETAIVAFKANVPATRKLFDEAHGYAIFPSVTKGAFGLGIARDYGGVYENGERIGYATLRQGTVGAQAGAQVYREVIFFQDRSALDRFKRGGLAFSGQASAIGGTHGKAAKVDYDKGIAVFTIAEGGLMAEASIGGQQFDFHPRTIGRPGPTSGPTTGPAARSAANPAAGPRSPDGP